MTAAQLKIASLMGGYAAAAPEKLSRLELLSDSREAKLTGLRNTFGDNVTAKPASEEDHANT